MTGFSFTVFNKSPNLLFNSFTTKLTISSIITNKSSKEIKACSVSKWVNSAKWRRVFAFSALYDGAIQKTSPKAWITDSK